jgi:hypothetical protein
MTIRPEQLPTDRELAPQLPTPPAALTEALASAEAALSACRNKYASIQFPTESQIRAENSAMAIAGRNHANARIALAEWKAGHLKPLLESEKAALPALEQALLAADLAYRSQRRRFTLAASAMDNCGGEIADAQRLLRRLAPLPEESEKRRIRMESATAL